MNLFGELIDDVLDSDGEGAVAAGGLDGGGELGGGGEAGGSGAGDEGVVSGRGVERWRFQSGGDGGVGEEEGADEGSAVGEFVLVEGAELVFAGAAFGGGVGYGGDAVAAVGPDDDDDAVVEDGGDVFGEFGAVDFEVKVGVGDDGGG